MRYEDDLDLERRLRRIADDPEPEVPVSLYRFADGVAAGTPTTERTTAVAPTARMAAPRTHRPQVKIMAGLAAALVIAMVGGALLTAWQRSPLAASQSPTSDQWTGVEWHDITATSEALFETDAWQSYGSPAGNDVVAWRGGLVATSGGLGASGPIGVWTSTDGRSWQHVPGSPTLDSVAAIDSGLIGVGQVSGPCPSSSSIPTGATCTLAGGTWLSSDGVSWRSVSVPFGDRYVDGLTSTSRGAVVVTSPLAGGIGVGPYVLYATTDGASWSRVPFPEDISQAQAVSVSSLREGFLASAYFAPGVAHFWFSADGLAWSRVQFGSPLPEGVEMHSGLAGDVALSFPDSFHSIDGSQWVRDTDNGFAGISGMMDWISDGRHILIPAGWDPVFNVSVGDGHWRRLEQGGDVGSLPGGGQVFLLPNGLLYEGGGRLFFGQAVAGVPPGRTLRPAASISAPPTPTPTPETPRPSVTLPPATPWTGVSDIKKLDGGPASATSITRWKGGYVAMRNAPASGGLLTVWTSPDGIAWTQLADGTFGKATTAVCGQDGDQVVIATWGGENNVWASSDGVSWAKNPNGNPPIGDRPMAGNSWGLVAIMDDPQYQLVFDLNWQTVSIPGIDVNSIRDVAVAGDRYVAVGHVAGAQAGSSKPAAWWSDDGTTWTAALIDDAPGDGFVSVAAGRNGFVATGSATGAAVGSTSYWTSPDGKTWHRGNAMGPFPAGATFAGDGTHILGWGLGSDGELELWTSLEGRQWTKLYLAGDTAAILSSSSSVGAYVLDDGVIFVTHDGAWYGRAQTAG